MSTRSLIGTLDDRRFRVAYCHHDGYPNGVGRLLADHHSSREAVEALLEIGGIRTLREGDDHELLRDPDPAFEGDVAELGAEADDRWVKWAYLLADDGWLAGHRRGGQWSWEPLADALARAEAAA